MNHVAKKLLTWFISIGKVKACILHFLLLCAAYTFFIIIADIVIAYAKHISFKQVWNDNLSFCFFFFVFAPFLSYRFYNDAQMQLGNLEKLQQRGLTHHDLGRIAFVKKWQLTRRTGLTRFCFYNGGLITGLIFLFPVSFIILMNYSNIATLFSNLNGIILFVAENMVLSYIIGFAIYRFKWSYNERRFMRLTQPV